MNSLDILLLCLTALAAWRGWRRGLLLQLCSWGGLLLGAAAGTLLGPRIAPVTPGSAQSSVALGTMLAGAILGSLCGRLLGGRLRSAARKTPVRPLDHLGGAAVSAAALAVLVWFISFNLVSGPYAALATEIQNSAGVRMLDATFPDPPAMLAQVRTLLDDAGFPQVFSGVPQQPAEPVAPPSDAQAARAFAAGRDATVRISTEVCGEIHEGSGFVAAPELVVTNAHVVAGAKHDILVQHDGRDVGATLVLFDPALDIAIVRTENVGVPPLALAPADPAVQRGDVGAVTGYPEGGQFTGTKAAVRRTLEASGRDIYGEAMVVRPVLELQAHIRPGNSGGPFIREDGTVGGVVFAASATDPGIGYAIAGTTLPPLLTQANGVSGEVAAGHCVR